MALLTDKVAVVTGAGRGIGSAIVRQLAGEGAKVVAHFRRSSAGIDELVAQFPGSVYPRQADLTNADEAAGLIEAAIERFGRVDALVNNAASFHADMVFENDQWEAYVDEFNGVVGTMFHTTQSVIPHMKAQGGGRIVNFVATLVHRPAAGYGAHTAAKAAVLAITRTLARELGSHHITVNAVSPGMTLTDYSQGLPEVARAEVAGRTPLGRLAEPDDVARVVVFYASDLAGFITGAVIAPDGGLAIIG
ncbi:MAG: SDR family oxidoreductase [Capsulimonadaceae bacterium]|nr:SDR family oxidoreductase [Capsulimonadaceae bacterium]